MRDAERGRAGNADAEAHSGTARPHVSRSALESARRPASTLRSVLPADFEALYLLDQICFEPGIAYSREELARFLGIRTAVGIVAEEGGRTVGFVIGYLAARRVGHVVTLDVHPERRRQGIGKALLEKLLERFSRTGSREARLEVSTENSTAIRFYESLGFRRRRRIPDYYGPGRDALEMLRHL
jgi:ribosomal-protein-alanine N-acetyltransferase